MENIFAIITLSSFCVYLYITFCKKPKIKTVKAPTAKQIRRKKKRGRKIKKIKRIFKLPYRGKTEIIEYDPYREYVESIWDELNKK